MRGELNMQQEKYILNNIQKEGNNNINKGITLISLVVTIVVLLILAGITIGTVFSDNGIVKKAQEAKNKVEEAARNEQEELNNLLGEMDNIINGIGGGEVNPPVTGSISGKTTWSNGSASLTLSTRSNNTI